MLGERERRTRTAPDDPSRWIFCTLCPLKSEIFNVLSAARHEAYHIEVGAYSSGRTVFNGIALGVMLGFTRTSMKELDAAAKLQTRLQGMDVAVHPRALQYAKTGSVLPLLFRKINALQRVTPIASLLFLGDNVAEVTQRRCWDEDILYQSIGGAPDPGAVKEVETS